MKVLNLYAGIGGNRKLWKDVEVTAIENNQEIADIYKDFFPEDRVIVTDAHQYLLEHYKEYDFIWSSPPCPSHSKINTDGQKASCFPDMRLYEEIIMLNNNWYKEKWVVENVIPYYNPLINPSIEIGRHFFWCNFYISKIYAKSEKPIADQRVDERYGINLKGRKLKNKRQILRNLVDPEIGLHILNRAREIKEQDKYGQSKLFE